MTDELVSRLREYEQMDPLKYMNGLRKALREAADRIESLAAEREWLPIESAPVGKRVLIIDENNYQFVGVRDYGSHWKTHLNTPPNAIAPIHWMPLPPAPDAAKEQP